MSKKFFKTCFIWFGAGLISIVLELDMTVQWRVMPEPLDFGGDLHQIIGRTLGAIQSDPLTMMFVMFAAAWLLKRYLFHKPSQTKCGEYLLSGFFSMMMLLATGIRATGSIQTLYANGFQILKVVLYLTGMYLMFLCALRGLNELLRHVPKINRCRLWDRHPFAVAFVALCIAWLPHLIIKYPGVLMIDSCLQFRQYLNLNPRTTPHPPFGTLIYGLMVTFGMEIGSYNIAYFIFTLLQTLSFIAVLSYSLWLMHQKNVPVWVCVSAFVLYALSPCYIGWSVVIVKDSAYLIFCMLLGVLLLDFACGPKAFVNSKWRMAVLALCLYLMILTRHNGMSIALPALLVMLATLAVKKYGVKLWRNFLAFAVLVPLLAVGTNEAIIYGLQVEKVQLHDWLSVPFQQTARVVKLHGEEISEEDAAVIDSMIDYDRLADVYLPNNADRVKWTFAEDERTPENRQKYIRVWAKHLVQYPMDYLDAFLNMNVILFDLQSNFPVYIGLTDNSLDDYVYPYSFNDMSFYDSERIRPLGGLQRALTEWYFRFDDLSFIGQFASMGFCMDMMLAMMYLSWINKRKRALYVWIPSVITAVSGLFCPIVYTRYLLPMICALPLWFAAYFACNEENNG